MDSSFLGECSFRVVCLLGMCSIWFGCWIGLQGDCVLVFMVEIFVGEGMLLKVYE